MGKMISIIIPIYNTEKYLTNCLQSVINQSYKNLEIILINDGSTDNSLRICNEYKKMDKRIIVINKKHTGVSDSRNIGIDKAKGEYIGFVDSDDYIDKDMFKNLIIGIEKYKADISMCDLEETRNLYNNNNYKIKYIKYTKKQALEELLYDKNIGNYMTVKLFKKILFKDITFPIGRLYEDISTAYKLFIKAKLIVYIPLPMYHYYQREESIVNHITRESIKEYLNSVFERYYILKHNYEELNLYNVYSIVNVVIKMNKWAIKIKDDEILNNEIYKYYCEMEKELNLVDEKQLIKLMDDVEKKSFYTLRKSYTKD